jgi:hypothetical protein
VSLALCAVRVMMMGGRRGVLCEYQGVSVLKTARRPHPTLQLPHFSLQRFAWGLPALFQAGICVPRNGAKRDIIGPHGLGCFLKRQRQSTCIRT